MISEGAIDIGLDLAHGVVQGVRVSSTRPSNAGRALVGREPHDALALVPLLFPVCGMAQAVACGRAIAEAQGARDDDRARGTAIALAEAIASHLFQLAVVWREAAGATPDFDAVRAVRARVTQLARAVGADRAAAATLAEELEALVIPFTTGACPFLDLVEREDRAAFGAVASRAPIPFDVKTVGAALAADAAFAERPTIGGAPRDASAFAAMGPEAERDDELAALSPEARRGLSGRLRARRRDLRRAIASLKAALREVASDAQGAPGPGRSDGEGIGTAETARGPLVHWVRIEGGRIRELRVVAPTDWTFHPEGTLREALLGAPATATLARDVRWLALALDPCVPFTVEVRDA